MKSLNSILVTILLAAFCSQGCRKGSIWGIRGEGNNVTEVRNVSGFNGINLSMDADILYTQDSVYRLEVTGQNNILAVLETKLDGNTLSIDFKRNVWRHNKLSLVIHSPNLYKLTISGNGNIEIPGMLNSSSLDMNVSGNGDISVSSLSVQTINAKISGNGNIRLNSGNSISEYFSISGAGSMTSDMVVAAYGNATISGNGNVSLNCTETLNVKISGSGDVQYRGHPSITSEISGSGRLIHLD